STGAAQQNFVSFGTGVDFAPEVPLANDPVLVLGQETNACDTSPALASSTSAGTFDFDGDGQADFWQGNQLYEITSPQAQLGIAPVNGAPQAGRLVSIDNGYGAVTHIAYQSAKTDARTHHNLAGTEIVVAAVTTTDAAQKALTSTVRYAHGETGM